MVLTLFFFAALSCIFTLGSSLGTTCNVPLSTGTAASSDPYWLESLTHQGIAAFNADPGSYKVFRNVKDFGAIGNGIADDSAAIKCISRPYVVARQLITLIQLGYQFWGPMRWCKWCQQCLQLLHVSRTLFYDAGYLKLTRRRITGLRLLWYTFPPGMLGTCRNAQSQS